MTKYVNGKDASIWLSIGDATNKEPIDVVSLDFSETQNKLPVYGYKSHTWDEVMFGDIMVQGVFSLNKFNAISLHSYLDNELNPETNHLPVNFNESPIQSEFLKISLVYYADFLMGGSSPQDGGAHEPYILTHRTSGYDIHDVEITSFQQGIEASGNPLSEFFNFVGIKANAKVVGVTDPSGVINGI